MNASRLVTPSELSSSGRDDARPPLTPERPGGHRPDCATSGRAHLAPSGGGGEVGATHVQAWGLGGCQAWTQTPAERHHPSRPAETRRPVAVQEPRRFSRTSGSTP